MTTNYVSDGDLLTPTNVNSWLNAAGGEIFNVKSFGAVGDGVTDDAAAIQAALDDAETDGGGIVFLPPGNYLSNSGLTVADKVHVIGSGRNTTRITSGITSATTDLITIDASASDGSIVGMRLFGSSSERRGISIGNNVQHWRFEKLLINSFGDSGVYFGTPVFLCEFLDVECNSNANNGFEISAGSCNNLLFMNCYANGNTDDGWQLANLTDGCVFVECAADLNGGNGFTFGGTCRAALLGCTAETNTGGGFVLSCSGRLSLTNCSTLTQAGVPFSITGGGTFIVMNPVTRTTDDGINSLEIGASSTVILMAPSWDNATFVDSSAQFIEVDEDAYLMLMNRTDANRGAAGTAGRIIFNSDDGQLNIDDGTNWTLPDGTTT